MEDSDSNTDKKFFFKKRRIDSYNYSDEEDNNSSMDSDMTYTNDALKTSSGNAPTISKLTKTYGIGAKLLSSMGYVAGKGLGKDGSGITTPIETQSRPMHNAGLGMFSNTNSSNYHSENEDYLSSEDEVVEGIEQVKFNKTSTEVLGEALLNDSGDMTIVRTLRELRLAGVQLPESILKELDPLNAVPKPKKRCCCGDIARAAGY